MLANVAYIEDRFGSFPTLIAFRRAQGPLLEKRDALVFRTLGLWKGGRTDEIDARYRSAIIALKDIRNNAVHWYDLNKSFEPESSSLLRASNQEHRESHRLLSEQTSVDAE